MWESKQKTEREARQASGSTAQAGGSISALGRRMSAPEAGGGVLLALSWSPLLSLRQDGKVFKVVTTIAITIVVVVSAACPLSATLLRSGNLALSGTLGSTAPSSSSRMQRPYFGENYIV